MSKGNTFENDLLQLIFNNVNIGLIGDATGLRGSTTAGSLFLSLHTADIGEGGNQTTNEASYTGYARIAVARTTSGFTVVGNAVRLVANAVFGVSSSGTPTLTHWGLGTDLSGAGKLLYKGGISPTINVVVAGAPPTLLSGTDIVTED